MESIITFVLVAVIYLLIGILLTKYFLRGVIEFFCGLTIVQNGKSIHFKRELDDTEMTGMIIFWPLMLILVVFGAASVFCAMAIDSMSETAPIKKLCGFVRRKDGK